MENVKYLSAFYVVTSTVSPKILSSITSKHGFSFSESLTGFKYFNQTAVDSENDGNVLSHIQRGY